MIEKTPQRFQGFLRISLIFVNLTVTQGGRKSDDSMK